MPRPACACLRSRLCTRLSARYWDARPLMLISDQIKTSLIQNDRTITDMFVIFNEMDTDGSGT